VNLTTNNHFLVKNCWNAEWREKKAPTLKKRADRFDPHNHEQPAHSHLPTDEMSDDDDFDFSEGYSPKKPVRSQ
jgi:hypothetical protein